ncbi:MAG: hypothetical protein IJF84_12110 [Thermoguttaceae bacterium]|nr:hypothetical protein [Thermoguttaceae bacterium]
MKKTFVISCLALIALLFTGSDAFAKKKTSEEAAVRACIAKNLKATLDEDVDAYFQTFKPATEQEKKQTEAALKIVFERYDLSVTIDSYKLISIDGDSAVVEIKMTTKKIRGPEFKDNQIKQRNNLKKIDGKWYIVSSEILSVNLLNEEETADENKKLAVDPDEEAAIRACVEKNIQATQDEDFDAFWETCKPTSALVKKQTEAVMKILFKTYDLSYKLDSFKLTSYNGDSATVEIVLTTKKIRGPEFKNNQSKSEHYLKKIDGKWYIDNSKPLNVKYLD